MGIKLIPERLEQLLNDEGLTQSELAEETGLSRQVIHKAKKGQSISDENAAKIAMGLRVDVKDLTEEGSLGPKRIVELPPIMRKNSKVKTQKAEHVDSAADMLYLRAQILQQATLSEAGRESGWASFVGFRGMSFNTQFQLDPNIAWPDDKAVENELRDHLDLPESFNYGDYPLRLQQLSQLLKPEGATFSEAMDKRKNVHKSRELIKALDERGIEIHFTTTQSWRAFDRPIGVEYRDGTQLDEGSVYIDCEFDKRRRDYGPAAPCRFYYCGESVLRIFLIQREPSAQRPTRLYVEVSCNEAWMPQEKPYNGYRSGRDKTKKVAGEFLVLPCLWFQPDAEFPACEPLVIRLHSTEDMLRCLAKDKVSRPALKFSEKWFHNIFRTKDIQLQFAEANEYRRWFSSLLEPFEIQVGKFIGISSRWRLLPHRDGEIKSVAWRQADHGEWAGET